MTTTSPRSTGAAIDRFNRAFAAGDVDAVMAAMTDDCLFEDTAPPDGVRYHGAREVRAAWEAFFSSSPRPRFETEECTVAGDLAVVTWTYRWGEPGADDGHVRGIDLFRVRDGKVCEKRSYVKG